MKLKGPSVNRLTDLFSFSTTCAIVTLATAEEAGFTESVPMCFSFSGFSIAKASDFGYSTSHD
jgi:hypothetical protein